MTEEPFVPETVAEINYLSQRRQRANRKVIIWLTVVFFWLLVILASLLAVQTHQVKQLVEQQKAEQVRVVENAKFMCQQRQRNAIKQNYYLSRMIQIEENNTVNKIVAVQRISAYEDAKLEVPVCG